MTIDDIIRVLAVIGGVCFALLLFIMCEGWLEMINYYTKRDKK